MEYGWGLGKGNQPNGSVRKGSVCNLQKAQAIDHHTISKAPNCKGCCRTHVREREMGRGVICQQCAGIWFLQAGLQKVEMTPEIRFAMMNL